MRGNDNANSLAVQLLPQVTTLLGSTNEEVIKSVDAQEYPKHKIIRWDGQGTVPEFYNENINNDGTNSIFLFINDYNILTSPDALNIIVAKFLKHNFAPCAVYSDAINVQSDFQLEQYLPAFQADLFSTAKIAINQAIAINSKFLGTVRFNDKLEYLYFFDIIRRLSTMGLLMHIAEPLFYTINNNEATNKDMQTLNE